LRLLKILFASLLAALALAACGPAASQTWPGLGTDGKLVYVAQGQQVHAVSVDTGLEAWKFPITPSNDTGQFVAEPSVSPTIVVIGSEGAAKSYSGILYGLEAWSLSWRVGISNARALCSPIFLKASRHCAAARTICRCI